MPEPRLKNVVVVDDDAGMNQAIERLLNAAGFHALMFSSADALLESGAAASAECMVLDIHLPGLSGFELRQRLAREGVVLPVIFITAYDDPDSHAQAKRAGAIAYFTKPFPGQHLVAAITKALAVVNTFQEIGFTHEQRLAVLYAADPHYGARLFAFIGMLRGWTVQAFDNFEEALAWLSTEKAGEALCDPPEKAEPVRLSNPPRTRHGRETRPPRSS